MSGAEVESGTPVVEPDTGGCGRVAAADAQKFDWMNDTTIPS